MDYISAEEFKKQPEKVQKVLKEYMKEKYVKGDLVVTHHGKSEIVIILESFLDENKRKGYYCITQDKKTPMWVAEYPNWLTPLLEEKQLRRFIIDKGYKYIGINNFLELENKETWNIKVFKTMAQFEPNFELYGDTTLECCWKTVCEIAESEEI